MAGVSPTSISSPAPPGALELDSGQSLEQAPGGAGTLSDYIHIARIDHWFKNVFVLPGVALAAVLTNASIIAALPQVLIALLSVSLIASANYVINELLDAPYDRHHPLKHKRPAASGRIRPTYAYLEYLLLAAVGLGLAATINGPYLSLSVLFLMMGLVYNVRPLRSKERPYLDVLSESLNNPMRLLLGWAAVTTVALPPSSSLLAYWMGGAFLMAVKRLAEYRFIDDPAKAALYRRSFAFYTEEKLLVSAFFYALCSSFFLGVFLIKYRIEFLLSFPLFSLLFTWYLAIGLTQASPAQHPEKLYREKRFVAFVLLLAAITVLLFFVDIPALEILMDPVSF
jgi:4-hydroxybenzoate polyprenyltransferase